MFAKSIGAIVNVFVFQSLENISCNAEPFISQVA